MESMDSSAELWIQSRQCVYLQCSNTVLNKEGQLSKGDFLPIPEGGAGESLQ